jgi:hypothetical protein
LGYYAGSSVIGTTTLENAISVACGVVGVSDSTLKPDIRFYDFRYPNATGMTVIVETRNEVGTDSFKLTIPNSVEVYETSYSQYGEYTIYGQRHGTHDRDFYFKIDGKEVNRIHLTCYGYCKGSGTTFTNSFYDLADFTKLVTHTIEISIYEAYDSDTTTSSSVATVLIYREY